MITPTRRSAFTLIEVLVVVGIISVLIAVLLPAINRAREAARHVQCASQLRQIGAGLYLYFHDFHVLPARYGGLERMNPHVLCYHGSSSGGSAIPIFGPPPILADMSDVMIKYCGPKSIFFCPESFADRTPETWWPYQTGTIAVTYQFPFWLDPLTWQIDYPDYRRLTADKVLACDLLCTSDGAKNVLEWNHRLDKNGTPVGMNVLFGDGRVQWNTGSKGWVQYAVPQTIYWHYAQF